MKINYLFQTACVTAVAAVFVAQAPTAEAQFYDVAPGTEAEKAIQKLTALNIINGYTDGSFQPKNSVTRAEVAKMLTLLHLNGEELPKSTARFHDVPMDHWAANYVAYAQSYGWLTGYSDGSFKLDGVVTRGQFAKILKDYLNADVPNTTLPFQDIKPGIWYEDGVKVLLDQKITTGTSPNTFSPSQPITREQFAIFLDRAKLLDHAPTIPQNTVKPEQPANASLAALANPSKAYDAVTMAKVIQEIQQSEWGNLITLANNGPQFNKSYGAFFDVQPGTFNFIYSDYMKPMELTPYVLRITFNSTGVESFKVYTGSQFATVVNNLADGPKQLGTNALQLIQANNVVDTKIIAGGNLEIGDARLTNDTWYVEHYEETPIVIRVVYNLKWPADAIVEYYELSGKWNGEATAFSVKPLSPIQVFPYPSGYDFAYLSVTKLDYEADRQGRESSENTDQALLLYAINQQNDAIPIGTEIQIEYQDLDETNKDDLVIDYVYNGQQFVQK